MLPLCLAVFAVSTLLFLWAGESSRKDRAKRLVETAEPVEVPVWPCEIRGKICLDFSRADVKTLQRKYPTCYAVQLTAEQRQNFSSARSKILGLKVFNPTRVWLDPDTKEPYAVDIDQEIFWLRA